MKFFLLTFLLFLLFCCTTEKEETNQIVKIDINDKTNNDLPELTVQSIVLLEKSSSSLFGNIEKIEYVGDKIYLLDTYSSKSVMVFSSEGSFINKTKLGKGPNELINPYALFVDRNNKSVLIYDQALHYICSYDLELNFLSRSKYDGVPFSNFAKINKDEFLVRSHYYQDYVYTLYSLKPNVGLIKQFIPDMKYFGNQRLLRSMSMEDRILLISPYNYNIYQLKDNVVFSEYYFDFGNNYKITKEDVEKGGPAGIMNLILSGKRVSGLYEIAESKNFILFHVYFKNQVIYYIYSTRNGKTYRLNDYFEKGILPKCAIRGVVENDIFYAMVEPIDMMEFKESTNQKLVENEIEIQQNPYIITFSISE